jgi:hypothetical protein
MQSASGWRGAEGWGAPGAGGGRAGLPGPCALRRGAAAALEAGRGTSARRGIGRRVRDRSGARGFVRRKPLARGAAFVRGRGGVGAGRAWGAPARRGCLRAVRRRGGARCRPPAQQNGSSDERGGERGVRSRLFVIQRSFLSRVTSSKTSVQAERGRRRRGDGPAVGWRRWL